MLRSLDSLAIRQVRTRRLRAALTAGGIVLGVGMVFAVLVLASTLRSTVNNLVDSAWGSTDLIISAEAGFLPDSTIERIRGTDGVGQVSPWLGATFSRLDQHHEAISGPTGHMLVAGYDPQQSEPFDIEQVSGREIGAASFANAVSLEEGWAEDRGLGLGDRMSVGTSTGRRELVVVGIFRFPNGASFGAQGLALMPLASLRELTGQEHGWLQASVRADDRGATSSLQAGLQDELGAGVKVQTPDQIREDFSSQINALNVVLYFFSGVALFIGGFLILNSFNMTVLQRMREIGMLRTLGLGRLGVVRTIVLEALLLGVTGTILGLGVGYGLAFGLVALISNVGLPIDEVVVPVGVVAVAVVTGLVATLVGALYPAFRAGRVEPIRAVLETAPRRRQPKWARAALGVAFLAPGLLLGGDFWAGNGNTGSGWSAFLGIGMTMAMFVGIILLAPYVVLPLIRLLGAPLRRLSPASGRLAVDSLLANRSRTAATAAALTVGLAVVLTNSAMSRSFLDTIDRQIDQSFARDLTVQPQGLEQYGGSVPKALQGQIAAMPETATVTPIRSTFLDLPGVKEGSEMGLISGVDPRAFGEVDHTPIDGASREDALNGIAAGGVIIGKLYAESADLEVGDTVALEGPGDSRRAPVVGVLGVISELGGMTMQMSQVTMREVFEFTDNSQLAVTAISDDARAPLEGQVQALVDKDYPNLELLSTSEVKDKIEDQSNQQFAIFNAILIIAVLVSLLGVINTLAMSVIQRTREIGVLRALGSSRWQVRRTMVDESILITAAGALVGIGFGTVIGYAWVSGLDGLMPGISFSFPTGVAVAVAVAAVVLGALAAVLPARRAARIKVIAALSYE